MTRIRRLSVTLIALTAILAGCENPVLEQRWDRREDNLDRAIGIFSRCEAERDARLARTLNILARQHERDLANTRANPDRVQRWVQGDFEQWQRRQPLYRRRIAEQLRGNPANIERTLPDILE